MQFRLTNKLCKRIGERSLDPPVNVVSPFFDWASDHFTVGGYRFILIVNKASVLSWVFPGKGVNSSSDFIHEAFLAIKDCLHAHEFSFHYERIIVPAMGEVSLSKVGDRNMTGIMMDLVKHAKFYLSEYDLSCYELSLRLNKIPQCSREEAFPVKAFADLPLK
jgi:hypothetical protein